MLPRPLQRFLTPPRCLELEGLTTAKEQPLFLIRNGLCEPSLNPVYLIRQQGAGRGLFSLVSATVCHLHLAQQESLQAIVDLTACPSEYHDQQFIHSDRLRRTNPWEFYFQPVSNLSIKDDFSQRTVLASNLGFPRGYPSKMLISHVQELRDIACTLIQPASDLEEELAELEGHILAHHKVLGVHIRGQEQKTMPYHPLSPTLEQISAAIDRAIASHGFDRLFVASEDLDYVEAITARYPSLAISLPHFRTRSPINAYRINPRPQHKYTLGKEILIDTFLLSQCDGLVSSTSNVTEFARARNNGRYLIDLVIDNGLNASNPTLAKYVWALKSRMPARWGGFSNQAIQPFPALPSTGATSPITP